MKQTDKIYKVVIVLAVTITLGVGGVWFWLKQRPTPEPEKLPEKENTPVVAEKPPEKKPSEIPSGPVMDYENLEKDQEFKDMMDKRKEEYGVDEGVDMIVKEDESIRIADTTVSMQEILDKIRLQEGDLVEKDLTEDQGNPNSDKRAKEKTVIGPGEMVSETDLREGPADETKPDKFNMDLISKDATGIYGIYVVQSGDNVWNIHFEFLKNYFQNKNVTLSPVADEPTPLGKSSGVGKLLKFSEKMVYIYNVRERRLDVDLNMIHPFSKIVVFNLGQAFSLLEQIDYKNVNRIQFDGKTLWIPPNQGEEG